MWKNRLPKLEEVIRLTKASRRSACVEERERCVCRLGEDVLSSPNARYCFYSFGELRCLPTVEQYLEADGLDTTLSQADRQNISNKMLELGALRRREVEEKLKAEMTEALSTHGLLPPDFRLPENHQNVLEHKNAFFENKAGRDQGCQTFGAVLEYLRGITVMTFREREKESRVLEAMVASYVPHIEAFATARQLAGAFKAGNRTMRELDALGVVFICKICEKGYERFKWSTFVRVASLR